MLSLSAACTQDPRKEARQELQTLSSWAATLHLLGDSWREGSIPGRYAEKTLIAARETLEDEIKAVEKSSTLPADARGAITDHARRLSALASAMRESVTSDPASMSQDIEAVSQEERALADLARGAGAQAR